MSLTSVLLYVTRDYLNEHGHQSFIFRNMEMKKKF